MGTRDRRGGGGGVGAGGASSLRAAPLVNSRRAAQQALPPLSRISDMWMHAVEEEDAVAASECARLCDTLQGAEALEKSDGLAAFIAVAMGQSMKSEGEGQGQGGLMVALAQALMRKMTSFKVAVFEVLAAAAQWPSLKGQIAGSGVLGVVVATLLAPQHGSAAKALMARLAGLLAVDDPEAKRLGDSRREQEFVKLRSQIISSGVMKALATMVRDKKATRSACAAAVAISTFVGPGSDATSRKAVLDAKAITALLSRVPGYVEEDSEQQQQSTAAAADLAAAAATTAAPTERPSARSAQDVAADVAGESAEAKSDDSDEEDRLDAALAASLKSLAAVACLEGEGSDELRGPLLQTSVLEKLRALLADSSHDRAVAEQTLRCLVAIGRRCSAGSGGTEMVRWPPAGGDPELVWALGRLVVFDSPVISEVLCALLSDRPRAALLGDLRTLSRAVKCKEPQDPMRKAVEGLPLCDFCGCSSVSSLLLCTACRSVEYCSRDCQKSGWKSHKPGCSAAAKRSK